jgi:glucose/mannose-6-phosphate isomerase
MNLNDAASFESLDSEKYIQQIISLPGQLTQAWEAGLNNELKLPGAPKQIVICGMGGSAIGGELAATFARKTACIPISVCRDYHLPRWALNPETLVVASSYSGNTEETISAFNQAKQAGTMLVALTRGGKLAELSQIAGNSVWPIGHQGQPRAAVATSFGLLCALFFRLGLIVDIQEEIRNTLLLMEKLSENLRIESAVHQNPAKRLAGQLFGRQVCIVGSDLMAPVATRWVGQINELAKAWAQALYLPEMDHNTLAGILNPAAPLANLAVVFLKSNKDHPRNTLRSDITRELFMVDGINTDYYQAQGESDLEQLWSAIQFGDFVAYYLAMMYGEDPTPIPAIEQLKQALKV